MAAPTNHWKLGLFVVAGFVMSLAAVAILGTRSLKKEIGRYVTYFDESVQGLEKGAPIKFRGVTIGNVGAIDVAPDHRHVEVTLDLNIAILTRLRLDAPAPAGSGAPAGRKKLAITTDLRVQLASAGLTGVRFLQLDFFDVLTNPLPELPFPVPKAYYIPAVPSTIKSLEDAMLRTMSRLPDIADQLTGILNQTSAILGALEHVLKDAKEHQLPAHLVATLDAANQTLGETHHKVEQLNTAKLSQQADKILLGMDQMVGQLSKLLSRLDGNGGLLSSILHASDAVGDTARNADGASVQLEETLLAVRDAAKSIHKLADALEKDPDMLLKGRAEKQK